MNGSIPILGGVWARPASGASAMGLTICLLFGACGKGPNVPARIDQLDSAFSASSGGETNEARSFIDAALSAAKEKDYAASVIALEAAQQTKGVTAGQLQAVAEAKQALTQDLVERADRGDAAAKAALATIERTRSQ